MKTWKKILIGIGVALVLVIIVSITVYQSHKNLVTVQTGKAQNWLPCRRAKHRSRTWLRW